MQQKIKHLYWRTGFGLTPTDWEQRRNWPIQRAVDEVFTEAKKDRTIAEAIAEAQRDLPSFSEMMAMAKDDRRQSARKLTIASKADWLQMMAGGIGSSFKHRMMVFWHGHFACRIVQPKLALQQMDVLEQHALGNFRDLVLGIARDPAMIRYLNNQQNRKQRPNENFARELMELFTIGRGHYTETDVKEAARAFTGWSSSPQGEYVFRNFQHDFGQKSFLGKTGNFDGEEIIDILLEQKQTAVFITRKIYRHFVNDQVDEARVTDLAEQFYRSNYDIGKLMYRIFSSDWFYDDRHMGTQIKSPVVLMAGLLRSLPTEFKSPNTLMMLMRALGQIIYNPPNVAGWPGGKNWIDNSTLLLRLNLPVYLLQSAEIGLKTKDEPEAASRADRLKKLDVSTDIMLMKQWLGKDAALPSARKLAEYLIVRPVQLPVPLERELGRQANTEKALPMILVGVMSLPEYQLC